jgi:hypothetical protein
MTQNFQGFGQAPAPPPRRRSRGSGRNITDTVELLKNKGFKIVITGHQPGGIGYKVTDPNGKTANRIGKSDLDKVLAEKDTFFYPKKRRRSRDRTFKSREF